MKKVLFAVVIFLAVLIGCSVGHLLAHSTYQLGRCFFTDTSREFNAYCYEGQILELEQWVADTTIPEYRIFLERVLLQTKLAWGDNPSNFTFKKFAELKESLY